LTIQNVHIFANGACYEVAINLFHALVVYKAGFTQGKISADICAKNCASWSVSI
jgi:hypothetical protein